VGTCAACFTYGAAAGIDLSTGVVCLALASRRTRHGPSLRGLGAVAVTVAGSTGLLCAVHQNEHAAAVSVADQMLVLATISALLPLAWYVTMAWSHQEDDDHLPVAVFHLLVAALFAMNRFDALVAGGDVGSIGSMLVQPLVLPAMIVGGGLLRRHDGWARLEGSVRGLRLVDRASRVMGTADDPAPAIDAVLALVGPRLGAAAAAVAVCRADGREHVVEWIAPASGDDPGGGRASGSRGAAVLRRVTGRTTGSARRRPAGFETRSVDGQTVLGAPLVADGATWGALWLVLPGSAREADAQRDTVERLGEAIGQAVHRSHRLVEHEVMAVAGERDRIARELHDSVTQTLYSVAMVADGFPQVAADDPAAARRQAGQIRSMTLTALGDLRVLLLEMRQPTPEAGSLGALLQQLADGPDRLVRVELDVSGGPGPPPAVRDAAHRIARQAVANARRHAEPTTITVRLRHHEGAVEVTVTDDGTGFDPTTVPPGRHGLAIMRERAASVDGDLLVDSAPGAGTVLRFTWPALALPPTRLVEP